MNVMQGWFVRFVVSARVQSWAGYLGRGGGIRGGGQGMGGLISACACFLIAIAGVFLSGGGTGRWAKSPLKFEISLMFPCFLGS